MRNRGRGPSMRSIDGNVVTDKVPGGSLIAALLDRQLMSWSDRGGASRHLGDRWAEQCSAALEGWIGQERPVPGGQPFTLAGVVRLDDNPEIAIQAGRHKLVNPDFVLVGKRGSDDWLLQAADAKFAVDTIRSNQVSADALQALLAVEGGLVTDAVSAALDGAPIEHLEVVRGVFISPDGPLTDYFLPRVTTGPRATVDPREVILLPVDPLDMFGGVPLARLIGPLARIDRLPLSPRTHLLPAMYYFRVASACSWMWQEQHTPLLSLEPATAPEIDVLLDAVQERIAEAPTAFDLLLSWAEELEALERSRRAVADVAAMPIRMRELRALLEKAGRGEDRRLLRMIRGTMERRYRERLIELVGVVPAYPSRPLTEILQQVATASRSLIPELRTLAHQLIDEAGTVEPGAAAAPADSSGR